MSLTFHIFSDCMVCGHRSRIGIQCSWRCRVNKHSIAIGQSFGGMVGRCEECRAPVADQRVIRLDDASLAKVVAARARRGWVAA